MPVTVGEVSSTVEVGSGVAAPAGGPGAALDPLEPTWAEQHRHRLVAQLADADRSRTQGGGFDA